MSEPGIQSAVNFLVPAAGTTHMFPIYATFDPASPYTVFFDKQGLDGQRFMPSGVFIDNSAGTNPITVTIQEISWSVTCPAGGTLMQPYPAPNSQHARITGDGVAAVVFVDFPVQPFLYNPNGGGMAVTIANGADVAEGSTTDAAVTNPASAASVIALLKGIITQNAQLQALLPAAPATGTVSNIAVTLVSQIALAANAGRLGATFLNDGPNVVYVLMTPVGPAAANTCSVILPAGGMLNLGKGEYTGNVHMIGAGAGGTFRVTEFTA